MIFDKTMHCLTIPADVIAAITKNVAHLHTTAKLVLARYQGCRPEKSKMFCSVSLTSSKTKATAYIDTSSSSSVIVGRHNNLMVTYFAKSNTVTAHLNGCCKSGTNRLKAAQLDLLTSTLQSFTTESVACSIWSVEDDLYRS